MINEIFRKELFELIEDLQLEDEEKPLILDNHAYDNSIVGMTNTYRLVYSYDKMIQEFMEDENCSYEEAVEWLEYNTMRAIPYFGERAPIIIEYEFNK